MHTPVIWLASEFFAGVLAGYHLRKFNPMILDRIRAAIDNNTNAVKANTVATDAAAEAFKNAVRPPQDPTTEVENVADLTAIAEHLEMANAQIASNTKTLIAATPSAAPATPPADPNVTP